MVEAGTPAIALADVNDRSRIILDDANGQQNRDPILYPQPAGLSAANTLRIGDKVPPQSFVLDQRFGTYRLQPVGTVAFSHTNPRPAVPPAVGGDVRVASFNVLNYFNGDGLGGGFPPHEAPRLSSSWIARKPRSSPPSPRSTPTSSA